MPEAAVKLLELLGYIVLAQMILGIMVLVAVGRDD